MIHDDGQSNFSGNRPFQDVLNTRMSRRSMLQKSMMLSAAGFIGAIAGDNVLQKAEAAIVGDAGNKVEIKKGKSPLIGFSAVPVADGNKTVPSISGDYEYQVLIPWGTALQPGGTEYNGDPNTRPTAAQQAEQIGIGHDGMWFFPIGEGNDHGMLAVNHEYGGNDHLLGKSNPTSLEDVRVSQHAHGVAVVEIKKNNGVWAVVPSDKSRRIHGNTPVTFSGPVANSSLIQTAAGNAPQGTINNCANGHTPWGTYLTCEENFNGYFGAKSAWTATDAQKRYGLSGTGSGYGWHNYDARFDLSDASYKNEENRFGWVVEIDPMNPTQTPVKRTALGRFKHEGADVVVGQDGRAVVYLGDDERFEYIYKFVSADNWQSMRTRGISPLDEGTLYVAKFNDDGSGEWLELSLNNPQVQAKFSSQAEILTYARAAADAAGATPMDRPEWTTVGADGLVYCSLTNNTNRGKTDLPAANAANPLAPNPNGHIIRWEDADKHVGTTFTWNIFVLAADTKGTEDSFASPDGLWADPDGRLFIQTDGSQNDGLNDQMLVADIKTKEIRRLFTGVKGCEVTGVTVTPDRRTMFVNLQHPGDGNPAVTTFPSEVSGTVPRDCTIVITRKNGGIIGS